MSWLNNKKVIIRIKPHKLKLSFKKKIEMELLEEWIFFMNFLVMPYFYIYNLFVQLSLGRGTSII